MIRWTQPVPQDDGTFVMHEMEHPCTQGCGGWWMQPAAESRDVIDVIDAVDLVDVVDAKSIKS